MDAAFLARLAGLSDADLLGYLKGYQAYRTEAVVAALAELDRRGLALPEAERTALCQSLAARDAAVQARLDHSFVARLGTTTALRLLRIHQITGALLTGGLVTAALIYRFAPVPGVNPLGYEPEDTKRYLRELETVGGKLNVLAAEGTKAWSSLWQGRQLATTVAVLTLLLALGFWFIATRRARHLDALQDQASPKA
jgi:hypothetical protein